MNKTNLKRYLVNSGHLCFYENDNGDNTVIVEAAYARFRASAIKNKTDKTVDKWTSAVDALVYEIVNMRNSLDALEDKLEMERLVNENNFDLN